MMNMCNMSTFDTTEQLDVKILRCVTKIKNFNGFLKVKL
jgi:hypothetical protein